MAEMRLLVDKEWMKRVPVDSLAGLSQEEKRLVLRGIFGDPTAWTHEDGTVSYIWRPSPD